MFLIVNIIVLVTLLLIVISLASRNDFWTRLIGEIYHGIGIALMAGATVAYFIIQEFSQFLIFFISGALAIMVGIILVLTSEAIIIKSQSF